MIAFLKWLLIHYMEGLLLLFGTGFLLIMGALCYLLWRKMWDGDINLDSLLEEVNGQASMSRFQLLVFTLVVAAGLFMYLLKYVSFPDIPSSVLYLVGISASTYGAGKAISYSRDEGVTTETERDKNREHDLAIHKVQAGVATDTAVINAQASAQAAANAQPVVDAAAQGAFAGAVAGQAAGGGGGAVNVVVVDPAAGGQAGAVPKD